MNTIAFRVAVLFSFCAIGEGIAQAPATKKLSPEAQKVLQTFAKKDTNKDGVVSAEEELAFAQTLAPGKFEPSDFKLPKPAKLGPGVKAVSDKSVVSWLEHNVSIRNSVFNSKTATDPAKLSWTKNRGERAFYNVDVAVSGISLLTPRHFVLGNQDVFWTAMPVFEAHISNQSNTHSEHKSQDSLLFALPLTFTYGTHLTDSDIESRLAAPVVNVPGSGFSSPKGIEGGEFIIFPTYRTDRENDINAFELGLLWRPGVWISAGLNVRRPLFFEWLTFRWDPLLGIEIGQYEDGQELLAPSVPDDFTRTFLRLHGELGIGERFSITADYTWRHYLSSPNADFHYSEISLVYQLDPDRVRPIAAPNGQPAFDEEGKPLRVKIPGHFTIGATWKRGEDAPKFEDVDTYLAWFGVQF